MKNNLLIKNFITKKFYNTKRNKRNVKISSKLLELILKNLHKDKNIFHLFYKNYELDFALKSLKNLKSLNLLLL